MYNYTEIFLKDREGLDLLSANKPFKIQKYELVRITHNTVGKPWVVAQVMYGDYRLWWAICKSNNLRLCGTYRDSFRIPENPYANNIVTDFYLNREVVIPSMEDITRYVESVNDRASK